MNELKIIFNGGLKSCCSTYSAKQMKEFTEMWFDDMKDINYSIMDITEDYWESEPLAELLVFAHIAEYCILVC